MCSKADWVAILGGDGRFARQHTTDRPFRQFKSRRDGGNGELRRLVIALRAGSIDRVIILARWNGHSATNQIRRLCRQLGIAVEIIR